MVNNSAISSLKNGIRVRTTLIEVIASCISYDSETVERACEQPEDLPQSMKSNSRRKMITSKSGFTYPEASRRRN